MSRWQRLLCNVLGWHAPSYDGEIGTLGINPYAKCKRCKRPIFMDSQGNWFDATKSS